MADLTNNENELLTLDFPCDPGSLPTSSELPVGDLLLEIKSVKPGKTKENTSGEINAKTGKLKVGGKAVVNVQFGISEPAEFAGIPHTKMFVIGTDEDPSGAKTATWKRNATLLMSMFKCASVGGKTFTEYMSAAEGQVVGATVKVEKSNDPKYPDKHTPKSFWTPGTKQVRVEDPDSDMNTVFAGLPQDTSGFSNKD